MHTLAAYLHLCLSIMTDGHAFCAFIGFVLLTAPVLLPLLFVGALVEQPLRERYARKARGKALSRKYRMTTEPYRMPEATTAELRSLETRMDEDRAYLGF